MSWTENVGLAPARHAFNRYELKLVVSEELGASVRRWASQHLEPDRHAEFPDASYRVSTLYLDSRDLDVYHRLLDDGAKYRVRRYGDADEVYLERKLRQETFVRKKRRPWSLAKLNKVLKGGEDPPGWAGVFKQKIRARGLVPTALITYTRHAWTCGPHARLTLDTEIRACTGPRIRRFENGGPSAVIDGGPVVELKYEGPRPGHFDALLESLAVPAGSFSKYGRSIEALGLAVAAGDIHA